MVREKKNELIHIRIEPNVKQQSEEILNSLGINMSYAVSLFLNQIILRNGFPFNIELPKDKSTDVEKLASIIESTGGNGKVDEKNKKIIHLFAFGNYSILKPQLFTKEYHGIWYDKTSIRIICI